MSVQPLTLRLLQDHFPVALPLRDYLSRICHPNIALEKPDDLERYLDLVRTAYIATNETFDASNAKNFLAGDVMSEMYEVIDRVQVRLFELAKGRPSNIITMGYRSADRRGESGRADMSRQAITNFFPNTNITALQALEWKILLERIGEGAMYHLLLNTNIFVPLPNQCFCQLVGTPITDLPSIARGFIIPGLASDTSNTKRLKQPRGRSADLDERPKKRMRVEKEHTAAPTGVITANETTPPKRTPADIPFVRARVLYGRPVFVTCPDSGQRRIAVGLPPNHVLNRLAPIKPLANGEAPSEKNVTDRDTRHVLKHIFPRQFGLRNPFEPEPGKRYNTRNKFEDYTFREEEIEARGNVKTPKRLKPVLELVHTLIQRHWKCNYRGLRSMLCPSKLKRARSDDRRPIDSSIILQLMAESSQDTSHAVTQVPLPNISADSHPSLIYEHGASVAEKAVKAKPKFAEFICSHNEVTRFVVKATSAVIPHAFWGCTKNFNTVMKHVEQFVKARRFETITLHTVLQSFSTQECDWLLPEKLSARSQRPSLTDALKRRELVEEFLYWYFDGFVIPLLKTSFYATESGAFRHRVLFFRQDDWATLCRPLLNRLKEGTFERIDDDQAQEILQSRKLGYSFVRLLPKETGVRPIVNLRRRSVPTQPDGPPPLSINQILQAAFQILTYEKNTQPNLVGASVFGPNETYTKLKTLKTRLLETYGTMPKLYFVKMDVRTCFDSIEQGKLLDILHKILSEDGYMIQRYSRVIPNAGKVKRAFLKQACPEADHPHFLTYAGRLAGMLKNAIFVDHVVYPYEDREQILQLLKEHVTDNIVKIGSEFFRQTVGIPQGSVLSVILCTFFYGDLESKTEYKFTEDAQSVLCRFIDDYLFITTEEDRAKAFVKMMNAGHPEYGCFISPEKTLSNFDTNEQISNTTLPGQQEFPWCGYLINMTDLSVSTDYSRYANTHIGDTITVDRGRRPGATFRYKMLQITKRKCHIIYTDTALNPHRVAYRNVYQNFLLAAMKMHCYLRDWGVDLNKRGIRKFVLDTIHKLIQYTYSSLRNNASGSFALAHGVECTVREVVVTWLGTDAFRTILGRKLGNGSALVVRELEYELRSPRFATSKQRWSGVVHEARGMIEHIGF